MKIKVLAPEPLADFYVDMPVSLLPLVGDGDDFVAQEVRTERWGRLNPSCDMIKIRRRNDSCLGDRSGDVGEIILYQHNRDEQMMHDWRTVRQEIAAEINQRMGGV